MKNIKDLGEKEVILCTTIEDCEAISQLLYFENLTWCSGKGYLEFKFFERWYNGNFCFYPHKGEYCDSDYYKNQYFTIHKAKEFYTPNEVKGELQDILKEWVEGKFQKGLNKIIRERL